MADFFDSIKSVDPIFLSKWIRKELLHLVNISKKDFCDIPVSHHRLQELIGLLEKNSITNEVGRKILEQLFEKDFSPKEYVATQRLMMMTDQAELEYLCQQAIKENPQAVQDYKNGKEIAINAVVGWVMTTGAGAA